MIAALKLDENSKLFSRFSSAWGPVDRRGKGKVGEQGLRTKLSRVGDEQCTQTTETLCICSLLE